MSEPLKKLKMGLMRHDGGDKVMAQELAEVPTPELQEVLVAVDLVFESGALSTEHLLNVLDRLTVSPRQEAVETTLRLHEASQANTARDHSLRGALEDPLEAPVVAVAANTAELNHEA